MKIEVNVKQKLGCGLKLIGRKSALLPNVSPFREELIKETSFPYPNITSRAEYLFFTLFTMPIWPLGCYRIKRNLQRYEDDIWEKYYIYDSVVGEEKPLLKEIIRIYVQGWLIVPIAAIICILCLLLALNSE